MGENNDGVIITRSGACEGVVILGAVGVCREERVVFSRGGG